MELAESFVDDREVPVSPHIPEPMKPLLIIPSNGLITDIKENIWQLNTATFPRKETFMPEYGLYAGGTNSLRKKFAPSPPARSSSVPRQVREQFSLKNASKMARSRSVKAVKNLSSPTKTGLSFAAPSPDLSHDSGHDSGFSLSSAVCKMERKQAVYPAGNNKRSPSQSSSGHGSDGNSTVSSAPSTNSTGNGIDAVVPNAINSATVSSSTNSPERKMNRLEDMEENSKVRHPSVISYEVWFQKTFHGLILVFMERILRWKIVRQLTVAHTKLFCGHDVSYPRKSLAQKSVEWTFD